MSESDKMISFLNQLGAQLDELEKRSQSKIAEAKTVIQTAIDDTKAVPMYISELRNKLDELIKQNSTLEEKIRTTKEEIANVKGEIEVKEQKKVELEKAEQDKRSEKEQLEREILDLNEKKQLLEVELEEKTSLLREKEKEYTQVQMESKELLEQANREIARAKEELQAAKDENKIVVYLMEAGLLDAPEAEIVSVIASCPEGLKLDEIKAKVKIAPVRVQPTINNLLEKVIIFDPHREVYRIAGTIIEELK